ncbi:phosphoribosylglycinamide formyltransferase [archaeon 13_1_40CM_2_52_13]|nr:MAG: phosphoribosylglycinamide formyltransferase [archaeon 13_1_40CM_2_52_13]OLE71049.1 MAG: phosphoribosylglycinamide formyltransferase [archaeon 13_1_20CM_2_51_12]TMI40280.1 MAG: phosphoribosylglycinamide formyltransferase [Candidatus Bathyarchaeota archaeon]
MVPIGVLVSGRGSNLESILDSVDRKYITKGQVSVVVSNKPSVGALEIARKHDVPTVVLDDKGLPKMDPEYDRKTVAALEAHGVTPQNGLVALAGYFRILSPQFVDQYHNRIMNVHPALLPAFPGIEAQKRALEHGVKVSGATVHFVAKEVDAGPIILQAHVPVRDEDTVETLSERILRQEHRLYPEAIRLFTEDQLKIEGRRVVLKT